MSMVEVGDLVAVVDDLTLYQIVGEDDDNVELTPVGYWVWGDRYKLQKIGVIIVRRE